MSHTSELSKIYSQYQDSLESAQEQFNEQLKHFADFLKKRYDELINEQIRLYKPVFENQIERLEIKRIAENFFHTSDIEFVAIDGSCYKHQSSDFVSFYGGAYGSKGIISLAGTTGVIKYHRWEFNKDVSMVAFVPIPPEMMTAVIDEEITENSETPPVLSDGEISEISSLHTKIMQLAEVYLAYTIAQSSVQMPRIILMDNTLCGILANSSFSPSNLRMQKGDFDGESLTESDMQVALAHPICKELDVPSSKNFQPHFRVIAEAVWKESTIIKSSECHDVPQKTFDFGAKFLDETVKAGSFDKEQRSFTFFEDPRTSWKKTVRVFENICEKIFREKKSSALTYKITGDDRRDYFLPRDLQFLIGVGIRALIELCWKKRILLIGVVKDSFSRYFYRNYLGVVALSRHDNIDSHLRLPLTDRTIVETLPNIVKEIGSPWTTVEYDSCFMTLHPEKREKWVVMGYEHPKLGQTTRPERIFLRSLAQFFMTEDKNLASHALFLDRLAYPDWDDKDSDQLVLDTKFGNIKPFCYSNKRQCRLQDLTVYLLSVLVRNHYPEALGYPDPLHEADWGAKSLERRVVGLLDSSEWAYRANPRERTFREIRDSYRR